MAMVIVQVHPGVLVRMREEDAARENLVVVGPEAHKKAAPAAAKRASRKKVVKAEEVDDVVRLDD